MRLSAQEFRNEFRDWKTIVLPCLVLILLVALVAMALSSVLVDRGRALREDVDEIEDFVEDTLVPTFNLTMSTLCDDGNTCTWDLLQGPGDAPHCINKNAPNGVPCVKECLDPETTTCFGGECQGTCIGQCETAGDCPLLLAHPFIPVVDNGGAALCIYNKCVYAFFTVNNVFPLPSGACHQIHETNSQRGCTDLISQLSPYKDCMQSTWCNFDPVDDVCLFSFECSRFDFGPELIAGNGTDPVIDFNSQFPNTNVNTTIEAFINVFNFTLPE